MDIRLGRIELGISKPRSFNKCFHYVHTPDDCHAFLVGTLFVSWLSKDAKERVKRWADLKP